MDIADKVLQAKADYDAVYEAGKASGGGVVIDPDKIIEKTVSGSFICVNDVSEIPHKCTVSVDKDAKVTVCGKNLLPHTVGIDASTTLQGIVATQDEDGTIHLNGTATANAWFYIKPAFTLPIADYVLSVHNPNFSTGVDNFGFRYVGNKHNTNTLDKAIAGIGSLTLYQIDVVEFRVPQGTTLNDATFQLQLEHGTTKTDYEVYKGKAHKLTPSESVEVDSICPIMILANTHNATLTLDYHKSWGMQAEYDRFWDAYQDSGKRTLYQYAFSYLGWNDAVYKPKYPLKPINANSMFYNSLIKVVKNVDFSNCTNIDTLFRSALVEEVGVIDARQNTLLYNTFNNATKLHTIEKLILKDSGSNTFSSTFVSCNSLENITIEGTIGNNLDIHWSPLTHESLMSIINALMYVRHTYTKTSTVVEPAGIDFAPSFAPDWTALTTTGEKVLYGYNADWSWNGYCCLVDGVYYAVDEAANTSTYTLTLGATNLAKLDDFEKGIITSKGWTLV